MAVGGEDGRVERWKVAIVGVVWFSCMTLEWIAESMVLTAAPGMLRLERNSLWLLGHIRDVCEVSIRALW